MEEKPLREIRVANLVINLPGLTEGLGISGQEARHKELREVFNP